MNETTAADAVSQLAAQVQHAHAHKVPLRIRGGGTWMHARWPSDGAMLDVSSHRGVVEYTPGDLTITACAGTSLQQLQECTAHEGQWIALDPVAHPASTIGAVVATASDGPLSAAFGRVRDQLLGLEFITGAGDICRAGGHVVKNVAGFDLVRLHTGAWGTLGVLTELSLRVRAKPLHEESWCVIPHPVSGTARDVDWHTVTTTVRAIPSLLAAELLNECAARALGVAQHPCLLARLGGNAQQVAAQRDAVQRLGSMQQLEHAVWTAYTAPPQDNHLVMQLSCTPSTLAMHMARVQRVLQESGIHEGHITATPARGTMRITISPAHDDTVPLLLDERGEPIPPPPLLRALHHPDAHTEWWQLPSSWWHHIHSPVGDPLSQRVRAALDPHRVLNRGLLGDVTQ